MTDSPAAATPLPRARLAWHNGQPRSLDHDDVYFSSDGVAESERVFIALNRLRERFAMLPDGSRFTIGEIGFGTGLNLLVCARAFLDHAPAGTSLHFVSCERRPLALADLRRLRVGTALARLHAELMAAWPPLLPGWQRLLLADGRVSVSICFGDALRAMAPLSELVDAWLLDGFAPDRNPDAWTPELMGALRRASRAGATAATFSAAGSVRRALAGAGFEVERVDGQPHKKHYLRARLPGISSHTVCPCVDVVGAGIAGAWTARSLALRGCRVRVFERAPQPAAAASSNPWAVLHARISVGRPALAALRLAGLALASARLPGIDGFVTTGVLQRPGPGANATRLQASAEWLAACWPHGCWLDAPAASVRAGVSVDSGALWLPRSGSANLHRLCRTLLRHPRISLMTGSPAPGWQRATRPTVLCTGLDTPGLPLHGVGGRVEAFALPASERPTCVLSGHGYLAPTAGGVASGATFETDGVVRGLAADTRIRAWLGAEPGETIGSWYGWRAMSPDRLPLVGRHPGYWVNCGHGSTGLALAPLAAEIIASDLLDEPLPAGAELLDPRRFVNASDR